MAFKRIFHGLALALAACCNHAAHGASYTFQQTGYQDSGVLSGAFTADDLDGDGVLSSFAGEVSAFTLTFNGTGIVPGFSHGDSDLYGLVFRLGDQVLGNDGSAGAVDAEGMASNWMADELAPDMPPMTGFAFASGMGPLGDVRSEITDWDTGARLISYEPITVSTVPEPSGVILASLGVLGLILVRRTKARGMGLERMAAGAGLLLAASVAQSQTAVIWQQGFANGLGQFSPSGTVTTAQDGARLFGSAWSVDGMITSARLSTSGFASVNISYDRSCTAGQDANEGLIAEYALNGGAFVRLEMARNSVTSNVNHVLPAEASNASLTLRLRINANAATEACTVNKISLNGTPVAVSSSKPAIGKFTTFESGQVRPLALSPNGQRLYAVNTPDNRVEIFDVNGNKPLLIGSVPVGLEPVALAVAPDGKLWVVNHLSDSISIVDVSSMPARVVNTLLVGDEPRDIVFAGTGNKWAFITAAHRGQNIKFDPQLMTSGVGRADVWVFNAAAPGTALGGTPVGVLNMFGDTLRALARNADGTRVYAAVFNSGNKTTVLDEDLANGGLVKKAPPYTSADGVTQPGTGLIVQKNANGDWVDSGDPKSGTAARTWNSRVKLDLPDNDVFTIDASGATPVVVGKTVGVGSTLFNMAVNPVSGRLYVSNQEALNLNRFEGPGTRSSTVRGHFVESRVTVIDGTNVKPRHLNKHITSYGSAIGTAVEKAAALATPLEMAVTPDGSRLYLVAMGSDKLARFGTAALESDTFTPSPVDQLLLSGGGPTGLILQPARNRAFVLTRFDNGVSVVDTSLFAESAHVRMFNPEPAEVVSGRRFLYDARLTSSRGDSSCAGCHTFGDMDHLAWDLGNPDGVRESNPNAYSANVPASLRRPTFHPMKGPMTTQSLRGLVGNGRSYALAWRSHGGGQSSTRRNIGGACLQGLQRGLYGFVGEGRFTD